jgi:hypothetical protein
MEVIAAVIVAVLLVLVLALYVRQRAVTASLRRSLARPAQPRVEYRDRRVEVPVPKEVIREVLKEVPVVKEVIKEVPVPKEVIKEVITYVDRPEPDALAAGTEDLADPAALPDVPDAVPDSVADGARLGSLTVRVASARGDAARKNGRVRSQTATLAVLGSFHPPTLMSVVAAGRPGALRPQIGAAQTCRSLQHKLSDAAVSVQAAWPADADSDDRLPEALRAVLRELASSLADAAKWRLLEPRDIATELTCVLTRLGDGPRRSHLAFAVGAGQVLLLRPGAASRNVLAAADGSGRQPAVTLPGDPDKVRWAHFETRPGDVVLACTTSTATLLEQKGFQDQVTTEWLDGPPGLTRFLAQLNFADQIRTEDRAIAALWEGKGR